MKKGKKLRKKNSAFIKQALRDHGLQIERCAVVDDPCTLVKDLGLYLPMKIRGKENPNMFVSGFGDVNKMRIWELIGGRERILVGEPEFDGQGIA